MPKKHYILDCDTGRDDALAINLFFSLGLSLKAVISTSGNVGIDHVLNNNLRLLSLMGRDIPVFRGADAPCKPSPFFDRIVLARHNTLGNGMSDVDLPETSASVADVDVIEWIRNFVGVNGKIDYAVTGPATTLERILRDIETPSDYIRSITMMGGKFDPLWSDLDNGPDFNIGADPEAFEFVLKSGIPLTLVPMNATYPVCIGLGELKTYTAQTELSGWFHKIMVRHVETFAPEPYFRFHDPMVPVLLRDNTASTRIKKVSLRSDSDDFFQFARLVECDDGLEINVYEPCANPHGMASHIMELLGFLKA